MPGSEEDDKGALVAGVVCGKSNQKKPAKNDNGNDVKPESSTGDAHWELSPDSEPIGQPIGHRSKLSIQFVPSPGSEEMKTQDKGALVAGVVCGKSNQTKPAKDDDNDVGPEESSTGDAHRELSPDSEPIGQPIDNLRSPICCILGHADSGKTKLLDCIRGTEAGGITQQIGVTYFPAENLLERTKELKADAKLNVPGLLIIDTPGHKSFTNLRSRGGGLCDLAILAVDIMHDGLEPQTIEALNLLKWMNKDFIIALNKVDRLCGWEATINAPIQITMNKQSTLVQSEFNDRLTKVRTAFAEQGINSALYYENKDMGDTISIVPTSAISGEGIPDMLLLLMQWAQKTTIEKFTHPNQVQCTVLEVKVTESNRTAIDVVLVNGVLNVGDEIVVCGMQGYIHTKIHSLLTPQPMKELRVKGTYFVHESIKAAQGLTIIAEKDLVDALPGTMLYIVRPHDSRADVLKKANEDAMSVMSRTEGVHVQVRDLHALDELLESLKTPVARIPVSGIGIGPVKKEDVMKAGVMLKMKKEFAAILAFGVEVTSEAQNLADKTGVKILSADTICYLFDQLNAYIKENKADAASVVIITPMCVQNKNDSPAFSNQGIFKIVPLDYEVPGVDILGSQESITPYMLPRIALTICDALCYLQQKKIPEFGGLRIYIEPQVTVVVLLAELKKQKTDVRCLLRFLQELLKHVKDDENENDKEVINLVEKLLKNSDITCFHLAKCHLDSLLQSSQSLELGKMHTALTNAENKVTQLSLRNSCISSENIDLNLKNDKLKEELNRARNACLYRYESTQALLYPYANLTPRKKSWMKIVFCFGCLVLFIATLSTIMIGRTANEKGRIILQVWYAFIALLLVIVGVMLDLGVRYQMRDLYVWEWIKPSVVRARLVLLAAFVNLCAQIIAAVVFLKNFEEDMKPVIVEMGCFPFFADLIPYGLEIWH